MDSEMLQLESIGHYTWSQLCSTLEEPILAPEELRNISLAAAQTCRAFIDEEGIRFTRIHPNNIALGDVEANLLRLKYFILESIHLHNYGKF